MKIQIAEWTLDETYEPLSAAQRVALWTLQRHKFGDDRTLLDEILAALGIGSTTELGQDEYPFVMKALKDAPGRRTAD